MQENPSAANCTAFKLSDDILRADLMALCKAMHFMPGCSLAKACRAAAPDAEAAGGAWASKVGSNGAVCFPMNHVATICEHDAEMRNMAGCRPHYKPMCAAEGSKVKQCADYPGFAALPTTKQANAAVKALCADDAKRPGCADCLKGGANRTYLDCDLLATWGDICAAEPSE